MTTDRGTDVPRTPRTEAGRDYERLNELRDAIIEAVRSQDGVGGIKAFQAYEDFIEAEAASRSPLTVEALTTALHTLHQTASDYAGWTNREDGSANRPWRGCEAFAAAILAELAAPQSPRPVEDPTK